MGNSPEQDIKIASTEPSSTLDVVSKTVIRISSRKSDLALVQTRSILALLEAKYGDAYDFQIQLTDTVGDQQLGKHLSELGATGLFTTSLEQELLSHATRLAVHSLKDMPTSLPKGLMLGAIGKRENPQDGVIFHPSHRKAGITSLAQLPPQSVIGTSSLRREALVHQQYPHLAIKTIRGNIQTRLRKCHQETTNGRPEYDAIIVAVAGFERGGLVHEIDETLDPVIFGYGVGQGSIGVECCTADAEIRKMLQHVVEDERSGQQCRAERSLLCHIEGGCQISMGVNATFNRDDPEQLELSVTLLSRDGKIAISEHVCGNRHAPEELGIQLGNLLVQNPEAVKLLGPRGEKRALTYGNIEAPGDAAAAEAKIRKIGVDSP